MTAPDPVMMPAAICYQIIFLEKIKCGGIRKLEAISVGCSLMGTTTKERQDAEATWLRYLVAKLIFFRGQHFKPRICCEEVAETTILSWLRNDLHNRKLD